MVATRPPHSKLPRPVTGTQGLIRDAKGNYDAGYKVEVGHHLRPYKRLLVDVTASLAGLDNALAFANDLFNALESAGHRVLISSAAENFTRFHVDEREQLPKNQDREDPYYHNRLWFSAASHSRLCRLGCILALPLSKCRRRSRFDM